MMEIGVREGDDKLNLPISPFPFGYAHSKPNPYIFGEIFMIKMKKKPTNHPLAEYIERLLKGGALLPDNPDNVLEVVGILKSYGVVLDAYSQNLIYIAEHQFLVFFPFFKYFNGEIAFPKLIRHLWHDRINFEYAEYCMKAMMWHGGGGLDQYLDTPEFQARKTSSYSSKI